MATAKEKQQSLSGNVKNISKLVTLFDTNEDIVRQQIESEYEEKLPLEKEDWEDVDSLLLVCSELKDDMMGTFDACLSLKN